MSLLLSIIFIVIVLCFYKLERRSEYKITPVLALGGPYGIIMILVALIDTFGSDESYKMSFLVPLLSCVYIIFFSIVGRLLSIIFLPTRLERKADLIEKRNVKVGFKYEKIYFGMLLILLTYIISCYLLAFGVRLPELTQIKSFFSHGLPAHVTNFVTVLMIINFSSALNNRGNWKRKIQLFLSVFWVLFLLVAQAKYSMYIYVFVLIFEYSYIKYMRINFKKLSVISIIASSLFIIVYIARFLSEGFNLKNIPFEFIFNHFKYYLTGSFYAFSKVLELNLDGSAGFGIVFAPIINILNLLSGNNFTSTVADFVTVDLQGSYTSTNVFTFFGALHYETSFIGSIILILIIACVVYYNFYKMIKYSSLPRLPLNSYLCAVLALSFFNNFFGTFNVWEIALSLLIISFAERVDIKEKQSFNQLNQKKLLILK
ncbi:DUF6337 family protein [Robertmurraya andreesenii]|uniref:Oligosaccharide repeat unit polymerase n=1 Tax=Anoxybacillus andreesenii TaxID=1325932 RepID=A0ABT9UZR3_9BACL|nr:DUF6337 family protein [Robertmurraya andreesenii]MDQ0154191.1 oligosaccharide repeat unit polymerase [Robertmurraya andreesenii]